CTPRVAHGSTGSWRWQALATLDQQGQLDRTIALLSGSFVALSEDSEKVSIRGGIGSTTMEHDRLMGAPAYFWVKSFQCPSEMTSTAPSTTLKAVSSSIAYAGHPSPAAHFSAAAMVFSGKSGLSTCGKIEKSTMPSALSSPVGGFHPTKSSPIRGVITMLPPLSPTQTVSGSDGSMSTSPDCRIQ